MSWKPGTPRFQDQGQQVNHGKVRSSPSRRSALLTAEESGVRQGGGLRKQELHAA